MSAGTLWQLPDGRRAIELEGSQGGLLRVAPIVPAWQWLGAAEVAALRLCRPLPMRYHGGQLPSGAEQHQAAGWPAPRA